jgi:hypothetical protein
MNAKELKERADQVLKLEARERFKKLKQIGFDAISCFKSLKNPQGNCTKNFL